MIVAAERADFKFIKYLVEHGANVNYQMEDKGYALYRLIANQDIDSDKDYIAMAKYLVEHGADINIIGYNNYTLLHACRDVKMIEYLRSLGMDIYAVTENNATALIGSIANKGKGTAVTEYYINNCVDLTRVATFDGVSANAYSMAMNNKRIASAKLILDAIDNPPKQCVEGADTSIVAPLIKFYTIEDSGNREVAIEIKAQDYGIGKIKIFLNTQELDDNKTLKLIKDNDEIKIFNIKLEDGLNEIQVHAYDNSDEVRSNALFHTVIGGDKVDLRPNLYAVVIGIDSFKAKEIDLKYAQADALLFGSTLFKRSRELFSKVNITYLRTDADTTKESILNKLKSLHDISPNDLFVFYSATLGTTIDNKYYMLTSDVSSIDNKYLQENALSEDELRNSFKSIPAVNKLLLFDTCYSGSVTESIAKKLVDGLQEGQSANLSAITATGITEITLEGYSDGHSTFAYMLSDALDGEADTNNDGVVQSNELLEFMQTELPLEAKKYSHTQTPVIYENGLPFNIAKLRSYKEEVKVYVKEKVDCPVCKEKPIEVAKVKPEKAEKKVAPKVLAKPKQELSIGKLKFEIEGDSIFINTKDELKSHFSFINAQGETLVVFDFFSDKYTSHAEEMIESDKVTKIELGYHGEFYRVVLHTKIKQSYEYVISDSGIHIKLKN